MNVCLPNLTFTHTQPNSIQCVHVWTYPMIYKYQACITTNSSAVETKSETVTDPTWDRFWKCGHVHMCAYVQKTECKLESKLRTPSFAIWLSHPVGMCTCVHTSRKQSANSNPSYVQPSSRFDVHIFCFSSSKGKTCQRKKAVSPRSHPSS